MAARTTARTATTRTVTHINRTAVLDALESSGPLSRSQLRRTTGLSTATVDRLTTALLAEGLIARHGVEPSSGGRPSTLYRFAGERRVVVAAEVTALGAHGMVVGMDGSPGTRLQRPVPAEADSGARLEVTLRVVEELLEAARGAGRTPLGVALSVPGVVDAEGRVSHSQELGWQRLAVGAITEHRTGLTTLVENDANAIALGEWQHGAATGTTSAVSLLLGVGVGAGIVSEGRLVRGARSGAGEVGYLLTGRESFSRFFSEQGDLESRIGTVAGRYAGERGPLDAARLLDASAAGDPAAAEPAAELLDLLALSVVALATVIDPEVVVLSGRLPTATDHLVREIEHRLNGRIPSPPDVRVTTLGADAALLGVAELVSRRVKGSLYLA